MCEVAECFHSCGSHDRVHDSYCAAKSGDEGEETMRECPILNVRYAFRPVEIQSGKSIEGRCCSEDGSGPAC